MKKTLAMTLISLVTLSTQAFSQKPMHVHMAEVTATIEAQNPSIVVDTIESITASEVYSLTSKVCSTETAYDLNSFKRGVSRYLVGSKNRSYLIMLHGRSTRGTAVLCEDVTDKEL